MTLKHDCFRKIILFLVGFCVYITIEVCFRNWSSPYMGLMGGILFLLIDSLNNDISWNMDLLLQGLFGSILITFGELIVGTIIKINNWNPLWDYSNLPLNYNGVICFYFSIIWFFIALIAIFLADIINYYVFNLKPCPYYYVLNHKFSFPSHD